MRNDRSCSRPASPRSRACEDVRYGAAVAARAGAGAVRGMLHLRGHRCGLAYHHSGKATPRPVPLRCQQIRWHIVSAVGPHTVLNAHLLVNNFRTIRTEIELHHTSGCR